MKRIVFIMLLSMITHNTHASDDNGKRGQKNCLAYLLQTWDSSQWKAAWFLISRIGKTQTNNALAEPRTESINSKTLDTKIPPQTTTTSARARNKSRSSFF